MTHSSSLRDVTLTDKLLARSISRGSKRTPRPSRRKRPLNVQKINPMAEQTQKISPNIVKNYIKIQESFSPDMADATRPEPLGMFKAIAEANKLEGGLFEKARLQVNKSFKAPREAQAENINITQRTLPSFAEIIKKMLGGII